MEKTIAYLLEDIYNNLEGLKEARFVESLSSFNPVLQALRENPSSKELEYIQCIFPENFQDPEDLDGYAGMVYEFLRNKTWVPYLRTSPFPATYIVLPEA